MGILNNENVWKKTCIGLVIVHVANVVQSLHHGIHAGFVFLIHLMFQHSSGNIVHLHWQQVVWRRPFICHLLLAALFHRPMLSLALKLRPSHKQDNDGAAEPIRWEEHWPSCQKLPQPNGLWLATELGEAIFFVMDLITASWDVATLRHVIIGK